MNGQMGGQPVFILPEGTMRDTGKNAQSRNISAGKAVAESVRTTLGPKGMDKMLVDGIGDVTITNDGATILDEMEIEHPAAKMLVEVAKTQEDEVGDGTTTAVIIAGELLKKAEGLLDQEIHPTIIIKGFRMARKKAMSLLDQLGDSVTLESKDLLSKTAMTAMTGKGSEAAKEELAELAVESVVSIAEETEGKVTIDKDDIKIEKAQGGSIDDTELIKGIAIDKEVSHSNMPKKTEGAKIALLDEALEVKETETNAEIRITDPQQLQGFVEQEGKILKEMVKKIKESGANVLFCQKGIDDLAQYHLSKEGITAVRRVKKSDMEKLSKSTGANIVSNLDELEADDLGDAGIVEEKKVAGEKITFVRKCKNPKAVSILLRGGTEHVIDEAERAMEDAVLGVISAIEDGKVVSGGGSTEMEISKELRKYADSVGGREQLAINAFADALEVVPRTLAESTGMDPIDILVDIRTKHEEGQKNYGVNVLKGGGLNMTDNGIIEPLKIKTQAVNSASEAAEMILRIDDVVNSKGSSNEGGGAPGGAPGGMPPGAAGGIPGM